jgi:putative SOS response-associated peptidase YedK
VCNEYERQIAREAYEEEFRRIGPDWEPLQSNEAAIRVRPTDTAQILRVDQDGVLRVVDARWGFVPHTWPGTVKDWLTQLKGNPMTNARSEGISKSGAFGPSYADRRCLVPAVAYFEYTGPKGAKVRHRFTIRGEPIFAFPGVWDRVQTSDGPVESFALLTSAPGRTLSQPSARHPSEGRMGRLAQCQQRPRAHLQGFAGGDDRGGGEAAG